MDDRTLLELAAKAAGIETHGPASGAGLLVRLQSQGSYPVYATWNPLQDDGDALRLAVKLGFCIDVLQSDGVTDVIAPRAVRREKGGVTVCGMSEWHSSGDVYAATRRAIVLTAAEIGRTK